jgi:ankyrin repeat protein
MTTARFFTLFAFCAIARFASAQEMPAEMSSALKADDSVKLATLLTKDNLNSCYQESNWQYSILAQTVRHNAMKCFNLLITMGADVNKACNGYVPPLMHAAKYGRLEMAKILVAKGADVNYKYSGDYSPAAGETPLTYAEKNNQPAVADYLRSLVAKQ